MRLETGGLSAAARVCAAATILEEVMRYQFNFEAEPFTVYPEFDYPLSQEFETPRDLAIPSVTIWWGGPFTLGQLRLSSSQVDAAKKNKPLGKLVDPRERGGVYILERAGKPIYVGHTDMFGERWGRRYDVLRVMAVAMKPYKVRIGIIKPEDDERQKPCEERRRAIESVLIRALKNANMVLTNIQSINKFKVTQAATITNGGSNRPQYIDQTITLNMGQIFEL
jgi:hypothetical protein